MNPPPLWSARSLDERQRIETQARRRIFIAVKRLPATGQGDGRLLAGRTGEQRLSVGDGRILFPNVDDPEPRTIAIMRVLPRDRTYR